VTAVAPPNNWFWRRASLITLVTLSLSVFGLISLFLLPSSIYPEMTFPRVSIVAHTTPEPPELVQELVTKPLEQAIAVVPGVRYVRSKTIRGAADISAQLNNDADPLLLQNAINGAVAQVDLPPQTHVTVERVLPNAVPVITFNVAIDFAATTAAPTLHDLRDLRDLAELVIRPALVRVPGVYSVAVQGGRVRQVSVVPNLTALASQHLTPSDLVAQLRAQDLRAGVGGMYDAHQAISVVVGAQPASVAELDSLLLRSPGGDVFPLSSVAAVNIAEAEPEVLVAGPLGEGVVVAVSRTPGASTTTVAADARAALTKLQRDGALPAGFSVLPVYDESALVEDSMHGVRDAIIIGVVLAVILIALFLRSWRAGIVAAVPVPLTLLATFAVMRATGGSLNLLSLGGLGVSIGLVVDDAIVVTEGMMVRLDAGASPRDAAYLGMRDLLGPIIGTTATTVVVFAPLVWLGGVSGHFLGALALALSISVLLSMVYALGVSPVLAARLLKSKPRTVQSTSASLATRIVTAMSAPLARRPLLAGALVVILSGTSVLAVQRVKTGFLPAMDEGAFVLDFFLPRATSLQETNRIATRIDQVLRTTPEIVEFTRRTGAEMGPATATAQNRGDIMIRLTPRTARADINTIIDAVRARVEQAAPEVRFEFVQVLQDVLSDLAGNPAPIEVKLLGEDPQALAVFASKVSETLSKDPALEDFFSGVEGNVPALTLTPNRSALHALNVSTESLSSDIGTLLQGTVVAAMPFEHRLIDVNVRGPAHLRYESSALTAVPLAYGPRAVTLSDVTTASWPRGPVQMQREGLRPALVMTSATKNGDLGRAQHAIEQTLAKAGVPAGISVEYGGQAASAANARTEILWVSVAGAVLVLLVLMVQLRSFKVALAILFCAPSAVVGGLLTLVLFDIPLDLSSLVGCVLLIGLVVKNGILLIEHAQHQLADGKTASQAVDSAIIRRFRPIAMTTLATIVGLAPLAVGFGAGSDMQRPLAIAVIGGLVLSTIVTLVILPALAVWALRGDTI
jgi:multidrug efflux pump subunit AcrB